jgi:hypothetical protein
VNESSSGRQRFPAGPVRRAQETSRLFSHKLNLYHPNATPSAENGRKSQGATTPEGQARIVTANLQSGIFAETQVLMWEHEEELQELKDEYYARHPPASPEARCLLDQIVMREWHLRRFGWVEDSLWDQFFSASPKDFDACAFALRRGDQTLTRLQHRINSTRAPSILRSENSNASKLATRTSSAPTPSRPQTIHGKSSYKFLGVSVKITPAIPRPENSLTISTGRQRQARHSEALREQRWR